MPKWGLTDDMRAQKPWGLAENLLQPGKVITDPVHGDIYVTVLEQALMDASALQRLRRVRQLGMTHLVYPGATHTRFAHTLGTLRAAQDLLDAVLEHSNNLHAVESDLFTQWRKELGSEKEGRAEFNRRVGEVTVLTRLGSLLHDLCHVPFGHSIEDDLRILEPHDKNEGRFRYFWRTLPAPVRKELERSSLARNLKLLILSSVDGNPVAASDLEYPFVADLVGNTICADLLDYIVRDHVAAGLPLALGKRFTTAFFVTPDEDPAYSQRVALRIRRSTGERTDVITELLKHLRYRYELSERALVHHAKLAADAMVGKALEMWYDAQWLSLAAWYFPAELLVTQDITKTRDLLLDVSEEDREARLLAMERIGARAGYTIERQLRRRGDDSFLEWLNEQTRAELTKPADSPTRDKRLAAVAVITRDLLDRRLFKRVAVAHRADVHLDPGEIYDRFGTPERRRGLEQDAADYAELDHSWQVVIWLPPPEMRLKLAHVLVDDGGDIAPFVHHEEGGLARGLDIYQAHKNLWAVSVFVHDEVRDQQKDGIVVARLAQQMGIRLPGPGVTQQGKPTRWPFRLAARRLVAVRPELGAKEDLLVSTARSQVAARGNEGQPKTFTELCAIYDEVADTL